MQSLKRNQRGFTLVELSIVLVVIALIIGSVLTGQQIIQNARITKALNDVQAYESQFQTYHQNFGAVAGDDPAATTRFSNVTNGNGDGILQPAGGAFDAAGSSEETLLVWQHLRAAGLIKNQITSGNSTAVQPPNPFGGVYGFQNGAFSGATAFTTSVLCLNNVPSAAARAIDTQLDDGVPNAGIIQSSTAGIGGAPATDYSAGGPYVLCVRM